MITSHVSWLSMKSRLRRGAVSSPFVGYNYLAFDVIGDLAFESPFDMLKVANDAIPAGKSQANPMAAYGNQEAEVDVEYFPTVQILYEHGSYSASMGVLPLWVRPLSKKFHPWCRKGRVSTVKSAGIAIVAVCKRLKSPSDRVV
jgi:benzoate 4-monooxygenase